MLASACTREFRYRQRTPLRTPSTTLRQSAAAATRSRRTIRTWARKREQFELRPASYAQRQLRHRASVRTQPRLLQQGQPHVEDTGRLLHLGQLYLCQSGRLSGHADLFVNTAQEIAAGAGSSLRPNRVARPGDHRTARHAEAAGSTPTRHLSDCAWIRRWSERPRRTACRWPLTATRRATPSSCPARCRSAARSRGRSRWVKRAAWKCG